MFSNLHSSRMIRRFSLLLFGGEFHYAFIHLFHFIICVRIVEVKFKVTLIRLRVGVLFLILIVYFLHFSIFLLLFFEAALLLVPMSGSGNLRLKYLIAF